MKLRTCVRPEGKFIYGVHKPSFRVANLREKDFLKPLGLDLEDNPVVNTANFPLGDVHESHGEWIYEIPNPFPFRGVTYISKNMADSKADEPASIKLPEVVSTSMTGFLNSFLDSAGESKEKVAESFKDLPESLLLAIASSSTDPEDLVQLARLSCEFVFDRETGRPAGLRYERDSSGRSRIRYINHDLFEVLINNPALPDDYKDVMVLRPGVQGNSEIVGEWPGDRGSHVFEYLRRNSYIPWGHHASNMADDCIRYGINELTDTDFEGLRHLYYQRTYARLAEQAEVPFDPGKRCLAATELEYLRLKLVNFFSENEKSFQKFNATLWGWNYGFDFAASGYRLHASHQQIHQQFAMIPRDVKMTGNEDELVPSFSCGDMVAEVVRSYEEEFQSGFFADYIAAVRNNMRIDGRSDGSDSLIVYEDEYVMLFVPKAQTSQWELQLMTLGDVGNILEADSRTRASLDIGILTAMRILTGMGARMITVIEFPKRIGDHIDQKLLYSLLPKLPYSMGSFSEAQHRYICGHYPEDFAVACRKQLAGK
jgi:hypothetical protein